MSPLDGPQTLAVGGAVASRVNARHAQFAASLILVWITCSGIGKAATLPDSTLGLTGVVYSPAIQAIFIGTPSITRLPDGSLLGSYEYFDRGPPPKCMPGPGEQAAIQALMVNASSSGTAPERDRPARLRGYPKQTTYVVRSTDNGTTWSPTPIARISSMHFMTIQ